MRANDGLKRPRQSDRQTNSKLAANSYTESFPRIRRVMIGPPPGGERPRLYLIVFAETAATSPEGAR